MKTKEARQHIEDYRNDDGSLDEAGIADLLTWAYDKGWTEALEDLAKENELSKKIDIIREAIFSMSKKQEKYQTVLIMRELENMTYEDIATELVVNINTIKSRIKKGREILVNKVSKHLDMVDICGVD